MYGPGSRTVDLSLVRSFRFAGTHRIEARIETFGARERMEIEGLGESIVQQLVKAKLVTTYGDLYRLTLDQLLTLERMGKKSAQNLLKGIEGSKTRGLARVLGSIAIPDVGVTVAADLAEEFVDEAE